ncbi:hypothetical protein TrCOL_g3010 [Triparma columacea]|uniref:Uncharacterized protein n=1 Tax=Triparma columacea TaxID=722753 RepID=A0A9W7GGS1_9STRA|nr:hypothetical protein TrCOL_g3010 [Triparma columacea]
MRLILSSTWRCDASAKDALCKLFETWSIEWDPKDITDPSFHGSRQAEILRDFDHRSGDERGPVDFLVIDDDEDVWTNVSSSSRVEGKCIKCVSQYGLRWSDAEGVLTARGWSTRIKI